MMTTKTRWILSVSGGTLAALPWWGMPGIIMLVCFLPVLFVEENIRDKGEPVLSLLPFSFMFFFLWNLAVCWWMARIHIIGGMSVIILNSVLMSAVFLLYSLVRRRTGAGAVVFAFLWTGFEFLHYRGDLSWPWLSLGNGLASDISIIQWYEFTGVTGGSFWILMVNVVTFSLINRFTRQGHVTGNIIFAALLAVLVVMPPVFSMHMFRSKEVNSEKTGFLILQPGLDPYDDKYGEVSNFGRLDHLLRLAAENIDDGTMYIVSPETSVDSIWITDPGNTLSGRVNSFLRQYPGTCMILGATAFSHVPRKGKSFTTRTDGQGNYFDVYNSALFYDGEGVPEVYNKHYLANGVEQVPFQSIFRFMGRFSLDLGGVSGSLKRGSGARVFRSPFHDSPVLGPLICFESAYGEYAAEMARNGAEILIVISNDGWFKNTGAYIQHLRLSQIRAIETRRSVIRAANTGVSCHISKKGTITGQLGWWEEGTLSVSAEANERITVFSHYGDYTGRICLFFSLLIVLHLLVSVSLRS